MSSILYNDKLYGGATTALDADHVLYDNTDSGLTSSNVQDVVDELDEVIASLENPTFTEASTRANIASGESLATIFGKVKKVITDLEAVAFSGAADDVSYDNTDSGLVATDVQSALDEVASVKWIISHDLSIKDFNNFPENSIYHLAGTGYQNSPASNGTCYGLLETISGKGDYIIQTAYLISNGDVSRIACRTFGGTSWSSWHDVHSDTGMINAGNNFGGTVYYRKCNGIVNVILNYSHLTGLTAGADNVLAVVPSGFRPYGNSPVKRLSNGEGFAYVSANGSVCVHPTNGATSLYEGFVLSYIAYG